MGDGGGKVKPLLNEDSWGCMNGTLREKIIQLSEAYGYDEPSLFLS